MTASKKKRSLDFFEDHDIDPVTSATGRNTAPKHPPKKKAGFYLSVTLLERFNRHYHQMKLEGVPIENKSALLELALSYALDDLDQGNQGHLWKKLS